MIIGGVLAGTNKPFHWSLPTPPKPLSVKVGKSGKENNRFAEVVAKAFNLPALISDVVEAALTIEKWISPEIKPVWDDPAPLEGTYSGSPIEVQHV